MTETHEKRTETHACDLISRTAALDALGEEPLVWHEDDAGEVAERNQWRRDVAAIKALPSAQQWIPCEVKLPELKSDGDVAIVDTFLVTVAEKYESESEWRYHVVRAENYGSYIDDFWDTEVDWREGQEVHAIAWMPFPEPWKGET